MLSREPAEIGAAMRRRCVSMLKRIRWNRGHCRALPRVLAVRAEGKRRIRPARRAVERAASAPAAAKRGIRLDIRTQLLYDPEQSLHQRQRAALARGGGGRTLRQLANDRTLTPRAARSAHPKASTILYTWYRDGYLHTEPA
jgi:hypothetical protein